MRPENTASGEQRMSQSADPVAGPRNRETAMSVAYLRTLGSTQEEAALAAGVDRRTVQRWEGSSWWPEVRREAADRWLTGVVGRARHALLRALNEPDGNLALKVLERTVPELAPTERVAHGGALAKLNFEAMTDQQLARIAGGLECLHKIPDIPALFRQCVDRHFDRFSTLGSVRWSTGRISM